MFANKNETIVGASQQALLASSWISENDKDEQREEEKLEKLIVVAHKNHKEFLFCSFPSSHFLRV
jgi:hypothetical protein